MAYLFLSSKTHPDPANQTLEFAEESWEKEVQKRQMPFWHLKRGMESGASIYRVWSYDI